MKKRWMVLVAVVAIAVMVFGVISTGAWFSDTKTSPTSQIASGTLVLREAGITSFNLGTITNMAPGDKTPDAVIYIINDGSLPLGWVGGLDFSSTDEKLYEALYVDYAQMEFLKPGGGTWEPTDNFITNGVGSGLYGAAFNYMAAPPLSKFGVISLKAWDNNALMTPGFPYEHEGALKPGYSYKLTLRFGFAEGAGNEYQGNVAAPLNIKFKVNATQLTTGALNALNPGLGIHLTWMNEQIAKQP